MQHYRLSPHVFLEVFPEAAVMLVADRNIMVKINHAAARVYELASAAAQGNSFTRQDARNFLMDHYQLTSVEAASQLRSLLGFGLRNGVVEKRLSSRSG